MAAQTRVSWWSTHIYVYVPPVPFRGTSVSPHWSSHDTLQHFLPLASWGKQLIEDRLVMYTLWNRFRSGFWTPGNARIWDPTARWPPDKLVCHSDVSWRTGNPWDVLWFTCIVSWGWVLEYACEGCDRFHNLVSRFTEMGYIINIGAWLIKEIIAYLHNSVLGQVKRRICGV